MSESTPSNVEPSSESAGSGAGTSLAVWTPSDEKGFAGDSISSEPTGSASSGFKRGRNRIAAIALIAAGIGAVGGALASEGVRFWLSPGDRVTAAMAQDVNLLKDALHRVKGEVASLKTTADQAAKASTQVGKIGDRLDRIEKAQAEPAAKIAKLSEAVDKLKAQPAPDVTGSIPEPRQEPKKPPILDGWALRDIQNGIALVQGPQGLFDVEPGDPLPGLNRVEAIRREGGRWVVVTKKGWIVTR